MFCKKNLCRRPTATTCEGFSIIPDKLSGNKDDFGTAQTDCLHTHKPKPRIYGA